MHRKLLAAAIATAAAVSISAPASACPHGYKRVTIQGNSVCQLDVGGPTSLASPDGGGYKKLAPVRKLRRR